jgi:CubicO group peptidase (beta-lactamase class C family)
LYDLATDVGEKRNQAESQPEVVRELLAHATSVHWPDAVYDSRIGMAAPKPKRVDALPQGDWVQHGFSEEQRGRIRSAFQLGIDKKFIPGGALMLMHRGEVILSEAFGVADLESNRPFLTSSPCRIASLTKPYTATLLVLLAEQGRVSLDHPVERYLPEFKGVRVQDKGPAQRSPTLRQCLSHTAGFAGNDALRDTDQQIPPGETSLAEVTTRLARRELLAEPGTQYSYSGLGYIVAGRVVEVVTGRPYPEALRRLLLQPIGATDTTFSPAAPALEQMPVAYERTADGFQRRAGQRAGLAINPGGGLVSTLDNVGRFMLMHRNRGQIGQQPLLSAKALDEMYHPQPGTTGTGYGLGFNIMERHADGTAARVRHTGASGTLALLDFDRDLIVIVLTQVPQAQTLRWREQLMRTVMEVFSPTPAGK